MPPCIRGKEVRVWERESDDYARVCNFGGVEKGFPESIGVLSCVWGCLKASRCVVVYRGAWRCIKKQCSVMVTV